MNKRNLYYNAVPTGLMIIVWLFIYQSIASTRLNSKTQTSVYSEVILEHTRGDNFLKEAREVQQMTSTEIDIMKEVAYTKTPSSVRAELILEELQVEYFEHPIKKDRNISSAKKGNGDGQSTIEQFYNEKYLSFNSIIIYPNPAEDKIFLNINFSENNENKVELFTMMGQKVFTKNLIDNSSLTLPASFNKGIYFYKIFSNNYLIQTGKIIIQK